MRILGIDPGYATLGYGVVDYNASRFTPVEYGVLTTPADQLFEHRLEAIYTGLCQLMQRTGPQAVAVEELYFTNNQKTGIAVAQARGVVLLAACQNGLPIFSYSPLQVKQGVVGYGRAVKAQVMEMTRRLLALEKTPKPDDAADALAIAICHAHTGSSRIPR